MIKLALLGFWHVHAKDYIRESAENPDTEIIAAWDDDETRGQEGAAAIGVPYYRSLDEILALPDLDGVIVTTATTLHKDVIPAAARAVKHVFTEKVLGVTHDEARDIAAVLDSSGVTAVVALRWVPTGAVRAALAAARSGRLGDLIEVRIRIAHDGALRSEQNPDGWLPVRFYDPAEAAGGLMIDLGAHPLYLTRLFLGMPESLYATYGNITGRASEDQAVVTMRYPSGAIGVAGTSAAGRAPMLFEIFGTKGHIRWDGPGTPLMFFGGERDSAWEEITDVPEDEPTQFNQFVALVKAGERNPENIALSVDLSALAAAANQSAATDGPVRLAQ
ncbi:MAG TPA: Gfo/Idh/MocA family oxidoreductase [Thermomicrobiales bacterium]|jgi:predicted dehydrogenase|nr:Gfo/Idh/MocA family oxidoreductase [Thermomicrobiales bacterium]